MFTPSNIGFEEGGRMTGGYLADTDTNTLPSDVFDDDHYAATLLQKIVRSLQLGPKYYAFDLPRYFFHRARLGLPVIDGAAFVNPLREFMSTAATPFELPPGYRDSLYRLRDAGVRLTMPRHRLEAMLAVWWLTRDLDGDVIECGAYQGATSLLLATLGSMNGLSQTVLMLDTFQGMPATSIYDPSRARGEFVPYENQTVRIYRQAEKLGVTERIEVHPGLFADTFSEMAPCGQRFAFAHIDANIYESTAQACNFVIPRMTRGGIVVFDDYNGVCDLGARLAIDRYCHPRSLSLMPLAGSSAWLRV
jgi:O-methyltransferase